MRSVFAKLPPRTFVLVFAALAVFCFVVAGHYGVDRIEILRSFARAEGEVTVELRRTSQVGTDVRRPPYQATAETISYAPLVHFKTAQGAVVMITGKVTSSLVRYKPGEKLPVFYDPRNPQQAVLGTFLEFWAPILAWAGFGLVWALAAYGAEKLIQHGRDERRHRHRAAASHI